MKTEIPPIPHGEIERLLGRTNSAPKSLWLRTVLSWRVTEQTK
jgi:hypothetical protein